jgi:hypothetical protein
MNYCIGAVLALVHMFTAPAIGVVAVAVLVHLVWIEETTGSRK